MENREQWVASFREGWLAQYQQTGESDWERYPRIRNKVASARQRIDLSSSRLMLISSAGGYLSEMQRPFDAAHLLGDYSIRSFPTSTSPDKLAFSQSNICAIELTRFEVT